MQDKQMPGYTINIPKEGKKQTINDVFTFRESIILANMKYNNMSAFYEQKECEHGFCSNLEVKWP